MGHSKGVGCRHDFIVFIFNDIFDFAVEGYVLNMKMFLSVHQQLQRIDWIYLSTIPRNFSSVWTATKHTRPMLLWAPGSSPDSKVHGANMGSIWGRQDPDGPLVGPMNFSIWEVTSGASRLQSTGFQCHYTQNLDDPAFITLAMLNMREICPLM